MKIRNEVHTRIKFASQQYYKHLTNAAYNLPTDNKKIDLTAYRRLSGIGVKELPYKLLKAVNIYNHYTKEYNDTLDKINSQ